MKPVNYMDINGKYQEVFLFEENSLRKQKALFFDGRLKRDKLPKGVYIYDIRHSDEDWGEPVQIVNGHVMVNFFGVIMTYKPINTDISGYDIIDGYNDFEYTDVYVEPKDVQKWIDEQKESDSHKDEVMNFINDFVNKATECGIERYNSIRDLFMDHYSHQFGMMLIGTFERGELYTIAPHNNHIVWRDTDNRYYDIMGQYDHENKEEYFIPYHYLGKEDSPAGLLFKFPNM